MDSRISSYISDAAIDILDTGFQLRFIHTFDEGGMCDDTKKLLTINTKGKIENWFPTFVHEYCHFLQWKDKRFTGSVWDDTFKRLYKWVDGKEELSKKERILFSRRARRVELDCERRTVEEIKKYNLPIDIGRYIQKANAYIFSYNFLVEDKKEYYNSAVFDSSLIYNLMPKRFLTRYDRMPKRYRDMVIKLSGG